MHHLLRLFLFFLFAIGQLVQANDLFFSFSQELQSFYLSPQNSSSYFGRSELLMKGDLDALKNLKFKLDASIGATIMKSQDQKSFLFTPLGFKDHCL